MKKKSSSRPFLAHSGGGQETILYLRVALGLVIQSLLSVCHHLQDWPHIDLIILYRQGNLGKVVTWATWGVFGETTGSERSDLTV